MPKKVTPVVDRSEMMRRVRGRDTSPELFVRSALHRRGLRFRIHRRDLPGRPDIVLPGLRVVVFVHGCFWHGHDCPRGRPPASNREFWLPKLQANRRRDDAAEKALRLAGWRVETVWQCSLKASTNELVERLAAMRTYLSEGAKPSDRSTVPALAAAQPVPGEETNL